MRICVLGINYWPDETGIAPFTTGRCEHLAARGHSVRVFTGFPYYPEWRIPEQYRHRFAAREVRNGVEIFRSWLHVPRRATGARRILHEASFIASSLMRTVAASRTTRPDVLFVVSPPLGLGLSAMMLGGAWKVPYVFHVADLQPDAALDLGMLRAGRMTRALYGLERGAYRNAALVSTLTEAIRSRIISKAIAADKVAVLPDWADPALFDIPAAGAGESFRCDFGLQGRFLISHVGNMGVKQGLEVVLGAAELAREDRRVAYLLVGDGATRATLEQRARVRGLSNVHFIPLLPVERFRELLAASDVCLVTQKKEVADIVFPSKVLTLFAAARPVVASLSKGSEVARVVTESGAGLRVDAENPAALLEAISTLQSEPESRLAMGTMAREYARRHWDRERTLRRLERQLSSLVGENERRSGGEEYSETGSASIAD